MTSFLIASASPPSQQSINPRFGFMRHAAPDQHPYERQIEAATERLGLEPPDSPAENRRAPSPDTRHRSPVGYKVDMGIVVAGEQFWPCHKLASAMLRRM